MVQRVKDPASLQHLGPCCGSGLIPDQGISTCCRHGQKKKTKTKTQKTKKGIQIRIRVETNMHSFSLENLVMKAGVKRSQHNPGGGPLGYGILTFPGMTILAKRVY